MDDWDALIAAGARLGRTGLVVATEGNLSIRLEDGRLLITPSGQRKDELARGDLVIVPLEPAGGPEPISPSGLTPSSDLAIHRAVHRARPDLRAVAHAHLPASLALTLAGEIPDPAVLPETALLLPRLPYLPFGAPGSIELATRVAAALADGRAGSEPAATAVLLERHGAIAVGRTIDEAVNRLELVDLLCRVWRDARLLAPGRRFAAPAPPGRS